MKKIRVSFNQHDASIRLDLPEGIELGDIAEIRCKDGPFMVHIAQWDGIENNCYKCALNHSRCLDKYNQGICNRIITGKRVCFQDLCQILEEL